MTKGHQCILRCGYTFLWDEYEQRYCKIHEFLPNPSFEQTFVFVRKIQDTFRSITPVLYVAQKRFNYVRKAETAPNPKMCIKLPWHL